MIAFYSGFEGTSSGKNGKQSDAKIQKLKDHVSEVTNVMTENINKILERGSRLDNLEDRSGKFQTFFWD